MLANGEYFDVDAVILTSGHTENIQPDANPSHFPRPYPVGLYSSTIPGGSKVAVEGLGLVVLDVLMALTVGRGGSFVEQGDRLRYVATGDEPAIRLFSRSGFPYCAKAVATVDESDEFEAVVCTREAIENIQGGLGSGRPRRQIDFRSTVLPLILTEMQIRYYSQSAFLAGGHQASAEVREQRRHGVVQRIVRLGGGRLRRPLRRVRPGGALLRPPHRLRLLQGLRVTVLRHGRGGPDRVPPRRIFTGEIRLRGPPAPEGPHAQRDRVPGPHARVLHGLS